MLLAFKVILVALSVLSSGYAVFGNLYLAGELEDRGIPYSYMLRTVPGYLYRVCLRSPKADVALKRLAYRVNVAFVLGVVSVLSLVVTLGVSNGA